MIEFTIKTLDSNNHSISVEDDTTVFGLKQKLLEQLGIQIEQQRLIFFGRVLHDNKKLADYGVQGKVVHLVERPPPRLGQQTNNEGDAAAATRRILGMPTVSSFNDSESRPSSPTAARIEFLHRSIEDIRGLLDLLRSPDTWLPPTGDRPDSGENNRRHSSQNRPRNNLAGLEPSTNQANSGQNEASSAGPSQAGPSTGLMGDADLTQVAPCLCHILGPRPNSRSPARSSLRSASAAARSASANARSTCATTRSNSASTRSTPSVSTPTTPTTTTESNSGSSGDQHGRLPQARANSSRTQLYTQLLSDFMELEEQFSQYRILYIDWIRSTPNNGASAHVNTSAESLRQKQQFSNLISELHHSFAHAHHVISDLNFQVTPTSYRLTSDPIVMTHPIIQGLASGGLHPRHQQRPQQAFMLLPQHAIIPNQQQNPAQRLIQLHIPQPGQHVTPEMQQMRSQQLPQMMGQPAAQIMVQMPTQVGHQMPQQVPQQMSHQIQQQIRREMQQPMPMEYAHEMRQQMEGPVHHGVALGSLPEEIRHVDLHAAQRMQQPPPQPMQQEISQGLQQEMQMQQQQPLQRDMPQQVPQQEQRPVRQEPPQDIQREQPQEPLPQMPPQQQQQRQQPAATATNTQQGNQGAQAPILLGIPPQALNINVQSNPVTFQLEIETRSLEAAFLNEVVNHVSQFVANQAAGNSTNNTAATDNQGTPQSTDNPQSGLPNPTQVQINPPVLGLNLGTVHLGTFNLSHSAGMEIDTQFYPSGTANMETDNQGTTQSANNNTNENQENQNQNGFTSRQQALMDFENLLRGIGQRQGVNEMEVVMSFDAPVNDAGQGFASNNQQSNPGVAPAGQGQRAEQQNAPVRETNPPAQPGNGNTHIVTREERRLISGLESYGVSTDDFLANNPHIAQAIRRNFDRQEEQFRCEEERMRRATARQIRPGQRPPPLHGLSRRVAIATPCVRHNATNRDPYAHRHAAPSQHDGHPYMEGHPHMEGHRYMEGHPHMEGHPYMEGDSFRAPDQFSHTYLEHNHPHVPRNGRLSYARPHRRAQPAQASARRSSTLYSFTRRFEVQTPAGVRHGIRRTVINPNDPETPAQYDMFGNIGPPPRGPSDVYYERIMTDPFWLNNPHLAEININHIMGQLSNQENAARAREAAARARQAAEQARLADEHARQAAEHAREEARRQAVAALYSSQFTGPHNNVGHRPDEYQGQGYDGQGHNEPLFVHSHQNDRHDHTERHDRHDEQNYDEQDYDEEDYDENNYDEENYDDQAEDEQDYEEQDEEELGEEEQGDEEQEEEQDEEEQDEEEQVEEEQEDEEQYNEEDGEGEQEEQEEQVHAEDNVQRNDDEPIPEEEDIQNEFEKRALIHDFTAMMAVAEIAAGVAPSTSGANVTHMEYQEDNRPFINRVGASNQPDDHVYGRIRTRMRANAPNAFQTIYDRFLVCNSAYARRQVLRRRRLADLAFQSEQRAAQQRREQVDIGPPPPNLRPRVYQEAVRLLVNIDRNSSFAETMIANIIVSIHEATVPDGELTLITDQFLNLRRCILVGVRHQSFVCNYQGASFALPSLATLLVHLYKGFMHRLRCIRTHIRPNVDVPGSFRRLCLTHMVRLFAMMQEEPDDSFVENYRQLYADCFYDFAGMFIHIAVEGVTGFRRIYAELVHELICSVATERYRPPLRTVLQALQERAISGNVPPPHGPHRFVMRTDGQRRCICDEEQEVNQEENRVNDRAEPNRAEENIDPSSELANRENNGDEFVDLADKPLEEAERLLNEALERSQANRAEKPGTSNATRRWQVSEAALREQEERTDRLFKEIEEQLAQITGEYQASPEISSSVVDLSSPNSSPGEATSTNNDEPTSTTDERAMQFRRGFHSHVSNASTPYHSLFEPRDHEYESPPSYALNINTTSATTGQRPRRCVPTATVTSGSLNNPEPPEPILIPDSPPPRMATASPANKRMKQDSDNANGDAQVSESSSSGAIRKIQTGPDHTDQIESKRKFPQTRGADRAPCDSPSSEDSTESQRRSRVEQHWERKWVSVIDGDQQAAAETQPPYSDAYLTGMTARRRRRVRQARPPLQAGAFIHDCMSAASERALEGGEVERSVFQAFLETFRGMTAARVNDSEDYRPALHTAVSKFLDRSSSQEELTSIPDQNQTNE